MLRINKRHKGNCYFGRFLYFEMFKILIASLRNVYTIQMEKNHIVFFLMEHFAYNIQNDGVDTERTRRQKCVLERGRVNSQSNLRELYCHGTETSRVCVNGP